MCSEAVQLFGWVGRRLSAAVVAASRGQNNLPRFDELLPHIWFADRLSARISLSCA
jgi:hypothetical protein